jgi:hypothetical protein
MTTKDWTTIKMGNEISDGLPSVIRPFVPYRLFARIFLGLASDADGYLCALGHESFHAFQGMVAANRLTRAEESLSQLGKSYPWNDPSFNGAWKDELDALADALMAKDVKVTIEHGKKFLSLRRARRVSAHCDSSSVNLEQRREREEVC